MKIRFIWIIILLWLQCFMAAAQDWDVKEDFQIKFTQLTTKDGLSNNRILDIMQDKIGFIWIATENGLNRFDGYDFVVFRNNPTDSTTISSNVITSIAEDIYGNLWFGTVFGLNKYNRSADRFTQYFFNRTDPSTIRNNHIRALFADDNGILWIETLGGYLHKLNIQDNKIQYYKHADVHQDYYHYHDIIKQNDSVLWLGGRNMNVHRFNIKTGVFDVFQASTLEVEGKKKTNDVSSYFIDSQDKLWVTGLDGAYVLQPKTAYFDRFLTGSCFSIYEEKNGPMWFGTGNGIYQYNSINHQMIHITALDNNPHSLSHNHVNKIIGDRSGVIWVATNNGLNLYSPNKNNFTHYFHIPGEENTISGNHVTSLAQDKQGNLWIATASSGLNKMNLRTGKVIRYQYDKSNKLGLVSNHISKLYFDSKENLWIGSWSGLGFQKLQIQNNKFSSFVIDPHSTNVDWYNGFLEDDSGDIQLAVWGGYGIYTLPKGSNSISPTGKDIEVIPNGVYISALKDYADSILWLGGTHGQINAYNYSAHRYIHFKANLSNCNSYTELQKMQEYDYMNGKVPAFDTIFKIVNYQQKSFFSTESGLIVYDHHKQEFTNDIPESLQDAPIQDIYLDQGNLLLVNHDYLWTLDSIHQKWTKEKMNLEIYHKNPYQIIVNSESLGMVFEEKLFMEKNGELIEVLLPEPMIDFVVEQEKVFWLSDKNMYVTDISLGTTKSILGKVIPKIDFSEFHFTHIIKARTVFYIGTNKGLIFYNRRNEIAYYFREGERHFMGYPVHLLNCIEKSSGDDIWLGTTSTGLAKWNISTNRLINYQSDEFDSSAFWGHDVHFIFTDSKGNYWMGGKGLNLYQEINDSFSHLTQNNGLSSDDVLGMTEDLKGRLWIATKNGLSCFSVPEQNFTNYFESHGLPDNELTGAVLTLANGRLAFGTKNGFAIFHPDSLKANNYLPPVVITDLQIQDNQIFRDLTQIDTILIAPNDNRLSFHFSALDYNSPEQNMYQYMLQGLDDDWILTDADNRVISYSNLNHGTYQFLLKGSNNNGLWNEHGKSLTIIILPHYYEKWWFYLLVVLFIGFVLWMIILYRVRELKLQHKAAELEQRFLRAQMNPHFIFNSLGAIQSFIFKNEPLEAATYLSNFSELVRLILDNSRQDLIPIETEIKTLKHYLDLQLLRFGEKFDYELEVDEELENRRLFIPPMLAQPFIENSIEHAFAGMKEKGLLRLCFRYQNNNFQLICEDNGMGIEASMKRKKEKVKKHQSLATKITRERIKVLNKVYLSKIYLEIQDLEKMDEEKRGTRVVITIPIDLKMRE